MNNEKRKKSIAQVLIESLIFTVLFTILYWNSLSNITVSNIGAIIVFVAYIVYLYFSDKRTILFFSYITIYIISNILGVYAVESNEFYLTELGITSYFAGALVPIIIVHFLFFQTIQVMSLILPMVSSKREALYFKLNGRISSLVIQKFLTVFVLLLTLILWARVISKPSFFIGLDRFYYEEQYLSGIWRRFTNLLVLVAPICFNYYYKTKKKIGLVTFFLIPIYLIWIGHKFGFLILLAYFISLMYIASLGEKSLKVISKSAFAVFTVAFSLSVFQSAVAYNRDFARNIEYVNGRLAQQGQLWWKIYDSQRGLPGAIDELSDEYSVWFDGDKEQELNHGMYKIMRLTTPANIFYNKVYIKKSRYAYSTQASIYYYFKMPGLIIFTILSAVGYYLLIRGVVNAMQDDDIISLIIYIRLVTLSHYVLQQSDFNQFFSIEFLFLTCLLIIIKSIGKRIT